MHKTYYTVFYIDRNGNEKTKHFTDLQKALDFTKVLDARIERGTCGGYSLSN